MAKHIVTGNLFLLSPLYAACIFLQRYFYGVNLLYKGFIRNTMLIAYNDIYFRNDNHIAHGMIKYQGYW